MIVVSRLSETGKIVATTELKSAGARITRNIQTPRSESALKVVPFPNEITNAETPNQKCKIKQELIKLHTKISHQKPHLRKHNPM